MRIVISNVYHVMEVCFIDNVAANVEPEKPNSGHSAVYLFPIFVWLKKCDRCIDCIGFKNRRP